MQVLKNIKDHIDTWNIEYKLIHHEQTFTSEQSARARHEDLDIGGKAILLKTNQRYALFVLSAVLKIDAKKIRKKLRVKKVRFATSDELDELTGLVPGAVPPFGRPIFDLNLYVDTSIIHNTQIAFNAGSLTDSIVMSVADYLKVSRPKVFDFALR